MNSRLCFRARSPQRRADLLRRAAGGALALFALWLTGMPCASAASAPDWMHALVNAPVPAHDDKASAALLLSETTLTVRSDGRMREVVRVAYRILRPDGDSYGRVTIYFDPQSRILDLHGWSIPATGKDYAVRESDSIESSLPGVENGELVSDLRAKVMLIPATLPGSIIGYEYEQELHPFLPGDEWDFQDSIPVREADFALNLPAGWSYRTSWVHHAPIEPTSPAAGQFRWSMRDQPAVKIEEGMPPWRGIAGRMVLALVPPAGGTPALSSWRDLGNWYLTLVGNRRDASPEIRERVASLTAAAATPLARIAALAKFVQSDVRYVAISLGIGGHQPHLATDVFKHRYGDCKDKATLLGSMLREIGIDSYYVLINTNRGEITREEPPGLHFNHAILAIRLAPEVSDPTLLAVAEYPRLGRVLYFDPTDSVTPLGGLAGSLQGNYGLLVTADGGELELLPQLAPASNSIERLAKMRLDAEGTLSGEFIERRTGDRAAAERYRLASLTRSVDRNRPIELLLANSIGNYRIVDAAVDEGVGQARPVEWRVHIEAEKYGKLSGDLLLVRPRLLGSKASGFLETREPRQQPIEFEGPLSDSDTFEVELPPHFEVEELPPPVKADYPFGSYQSHSEVVGRVLRYTRRIEIHQLSVPVEQAADLRNFYRIIGTDEGRAAVLRPSVH